MQLGQHAIPEVALAFMNRDHQAFIEQVQLLEKMLSDSANVEAIDQHLNELLEHTRIHFAEEDKEMQAGGFPPYPVHQQEHRSVLQGMAAEIEAWQTQRDGARLAQYLQQTLPDWFAKHVQMMDFVTARWLVSKG
jgi:hemerythrin